jgi:hypothetical protein
LLTAQYLRRSSIKKKEKKNVSKWERTVIFQNIKFMLHIHINLPNDSANEEME